MVARLVLQMIGYLCLEQSKSMRSLEILASNSILLLSGWYRFCFGALDKATAIAHSSDKRAERERERERESVCVCV